MSESRDEHGGAAPANLSGATISCVVLAVACLQGLGRPGTPARRTTVLSGGHPGAPPENLLIRMPRARPARQRLVSMRFCRSRSIRASSPGVLHWRATLPGGNLGFAV